MRELELVGAICSRLCHDLISPVGAIHNGLEVMGEDNGPDLMRSVMELLTSSTAQSIHSLKFYRLAFGGSGGPDAKISLGEAREAVLDHLSGGRLELDWPAEAQDELIDLPKPKMKAFLNLILIAAEAMPRGGRLSIIVEPDVTMIVGDGPSILFHEATAAALRNPDGVGEITAKLAPAVLAALLIQDSKAKMSLDVEEDRLEMSIDS